MTVLQIADVRHENETPRSRKEEEVAAESFSRWLTTHGIRNDWRPVNPDPPDLEFLVSAGGKAQRWAVEVTQVMQYVDWAGEEKSGKYLEGVVEDLRKRLERAIPEGTKLGYILEVAGPFPRDSVSAIQKRAVGYIQSGRTEEACLDFPEAMEKALGGVPPESVDPEGMKIMRGFAKSIARFHIWATTEADVVGTVKSIAWFHASATTPAGNASTGHIRSTLEYTVQKILKEKIPRLQSLGSFQRKILLLVQEYDFAEPDRLKEVLVEKALAATDIDSVFLIDGVNVAHLLADPGDVFASCGGR